MNRQFSRVNMYNLIRLQRNPNYNYMESSTYPSENVNYYKKKLQQILARKYFLHSGQTHSGILDEPG